MLVGSPSVRLSSTAGHPLGVEGQVRDHVRPRPVRQPAGRGEGLVVEAVDRADQPLGGVREQLEGALGVEVVAHGAILDPPVNRPAASRRSPLRGNDGGTVGAA